MSTETHYRSSNLARIPQLWQPALKLVKDTTQEIIMDYYYRTVTADGDFQVPVVYCLTTFLQQAYNQLKHNVVDSIFICGTHRDKELNNLLKMYVIDVVRRCCTKILRYKVIKEFTQDIQTVFEEKQSAIYIALGQVGYCSSDQS